MEHTTGDRSLLPAEVWRRHENPKSGWSRVPLLPLYLYAVYHRDARLFVAALVWTVVNPVAFPPPERDDAWMTRAVRAERWWTETRGESLFGVAYPQVLNVVSVGATAVAVAAAVRQRPRTTTLAGAAATALKLRFVAALVSRYDRRDDAN